MKTSGMFLSAALVVLLFHGVSASAGTNDPFEVELTLLRTGGGSAKFDMSRENGMWRPVMIGWRAHGAYASIGYVVSNEITDTSMSFDIDIHWRADAWIPGYYGSCRAQVTKGTGTVWIGQAEMRERGRTYTNTVTARIKPARPIRYPDWRPMEGDEHPRIVVRKYELPRLREKLATPFGQKAKNMMQGDLLGLCLLYQLTQDKSCAERTIPMFENSITRMDCGERGDFARVHHLKVGMALDLCYDALPTDLRVRVEEYLTRFCEAGVDKMHWLSAGMNTHPCSNYYGPIIGSFAIASLLFDGRPGPAPSEPLPPMGSMKGGDSLSGLVNRFASADKMAMERQMFEHKMTAWKSDLAWWKADGGQDAAIRQLVYELWYHMYRHYKLGIGDGGFQSEIGKYACFAHLNPVTYAALYQRVYGRDASAFPDATHYLPRQMMTEYYPAAGGQVTLEINGWNPLGAELIAAAYNAIPNEYKPGLLWAWNHLTGVTNEASVANALKANPVFAFVNYPLDAKPVHPRESMPLTWQAPTRGLYVFRSGWEGKDEFISQVFAKSSPIGGWNWPNAGTFRVFGLGHSWVGKPIGKRTNVRELQSVVVLPDDEINENGNGQVRWFRAGTDGSGEVTVDYAMVYGRGALRDAPDQEEDAGSPPEAKAHPMTRAELEKRRAQAKRGPVRASLVDGNFVLYPENLDPASIKGWRAIAFDYSGKCGAPCLMAMVDKVDGGKRKEWIWQAPTDDEAKKGRDVSVKTEGNSFVLDYGDANMRGTFIAPGKVILSHRTDQGAVMATSSRIAATFERNQIVARGEKETEGFFLMVATFQRGAPPEVKAEGDGLATVVRVGGQTVRLAGDRIVFGQ
jgi:hypothetical protein